MNTSSTRAPDPGGLSTSHARGRAARAAAFCLGIGLATLSSPAWALQQRHVPSDTEIRQLVEHRLSEKEIAGVNVGVADRVVTLRGTVLSLWARNEAVEQAYKTDGVQEVVSELTIASGEADAVIAEQIATRIRRYVFFTIFDDAEVEVDRGVELRDPDQSAHPHRRRAGPCDADRIRWVGGGAARR